MAPPRTYQCEALTLKKATFGEADLMVTLYTREYGKLRAVAKGARRSTSKLVGHLEPLTQLRLALAKGRNLDIITQAQVLESFTPLKENLEAVSQGLYVAELTDGFGAEDNPNAPLYRLALETLHSLEQNPGNEIPLRYFELHLLRVSGLMPELQICVECGRDLEPEGHRFSPNVGGALCPECNPSDANVRPLSLRALKVLRSMQRGRLAEVTRLNLDIDLAQELKSLLGTSIAFWLGKEIRSNSFIEQLLRESKSGV